MRTVLALAVSALAGCDFQAPARPGGGDDAVEPDGQTSPPDGDDGAGDRDGDGIANATDNCPDVANTDQFNEDADARGDACDPCAALAGAADDADGDGDGIGDGCDPNPTTAGDKLVLWNGFQVDSATLPAGLTMIHGSAARWSVAGGSLVFTHSGTSDDWSIPAFETGARNHTVDAVLEITGTFPGSATAAGVAVDIAGNDDDVYECQIRTDNGRREMWYWNGRGIGGWTELTGAVAATPNDTYRLVLKRTPGDLACSTFLAGANTALTSTRDSANRTRAGLFMRNVDVRVHSLAIYTSP